jgi:MULE transposase domain
MEAQGMSYHWPAETDFAHVELDVLDRDCAVCGRRMYICDHRYRRVHTLEGPLQLVCKLNHCPDPNCANHAHTKSPEMEPSIAPPQWAIGWDVFCWIGHRRFSRHWAVPQIRGELIDTYGIDLSESAIIKCIHRYQAMLAARQQDPEKLRQQYEGVDEIILTIDGLQPEKGHEALYVVRELTQKRVWFAVALISASDEEVQRLIATAKQWAQALRKTVKLWISDKQDAFLKGVEAEFPGVPHRYCANHFLRDLAKPVVEADSGAKVKMRKKVRGLRKIEKAVLSRQRESAETQITVKGSESTGLLAPEPTDACCHGDDPAAEAVLHYCAAVRGILNDDQGGPLHPPGLRMAEGLAEVRESIQRNLDAKKGGSQKSNWNV